MERTIDSVGDCRGNRICAMASRLWLWLYFCFTITAAVTRAQNTTDPAEADFGSPDFKMLPKVFSLPKIAAICYLSLPFSAHSHAFHQASWASALHHSD
ncbi:hypothetical protein L1887_25626 [Cichorium endivia]|nr:hypothetical protein L1887_25626 [Cichorium endivia]